MRTNLFLSVLTSLALLGCPSPPDQQNGAGDGSPQAGPGGNPTGGGQQGAPGGQSGADDAGPGPSDGMAEPLDMSQDMEQTQEQVAAGEHFTVSGKVKGKCEGTLRIDVIGATAAPSTDGDPNQNNDAAAARLLTASVLDAVGEFSIAVPKGDFEMIEIAALCDVNGDNKITGGTDSISGPEDASDLDEDTTGVNLKLEKLPEPVEPEEGAPPEEATGASDERGYVPAEGEDPDAGALRPEDGSAGNQAPPNEAGTPPNPPGDGQQPPQQPPNEAGTPPTPPGDGQAPPPPPEGAPPPPQGE